MLRRIFVVAMVVLACVLFSTMAIAQTPVTAVSTVTVNVASAVSITGLDAIVFSATPGVVDSSGSDAFLVNTNVSGSTYAAVVTTQPTGLSGMTCSLSPATLTVPGTTNATLTALITVPFNVTAGAHSGGLITVTVSPGL